MTNEERIAILEQKLKTLQVYYAAAMADATLRYGEAGVLAAVAERKRAEQLKAGAEMAKLYGISDPRQVFQKVQETYGCAEWVMEGTESGFAATCTNCMLCAISKKKGVFSPCQINCLSPIEAMVRGLSPGAEFVVKKTLWNDDECAVIVNNLGTS
ncbi:MAG: hypothetical protein FWG42_04700 [Clostridiales bacterium]|nr:hypothetical protein [Clostridiales bacterium]